MGQGLSLSYVFRNPHLLEDALCHPSVLGTRKRSGAAGLISNFERLEFLGDRVIGLVIASHLVEAFKQADEGELARRFTNLVRRETLSQIALLLGLEHHIVLSASARRSKVAENPSVLADSLESLIGAIFLDGGYEPASLFVLHHWKQFLENPSLGAATDPKSQVQEYAQGGACAVSPLYRVVSETGPSHHPHFVIELHVEGHPVFQGEGSSKKKAEQEAAALFVAYLREKEEG